MIVCQKVGHTVSSCFSFSAEKKDFVRDGHLCFGCLQPGHLSKECATRLTCDKCQRSHPTCLHYDDFKGKSSHGSSKENSPVTTEHISQVGVESVLSLSVSGGGATNMSTVAPVWISTLDWPRDEIEILVYALLDTQSDTTFVSQDISDLLKADRACTAKVNYDDQQRHGCSLRESNGIECAGIQRRKADHLAHSLHPSLYSARPLPHPHERDC